MAQFQLGQFATTPPPPPSGYCLIYFKTDNVLYIQDAGGTETAIGTANGITQLTGQVTATGPGIATATLSNSAVIGQVLTGFTPGPNSAITSSDTLLTALQKAQAQISAASGITSLSGDVSATGPGAATATVNSVGGQSAANIASAVVTVDNATSTNTASTLVERDASGNFSANIITASLSGNATTATTSTNFSGSLAGDVTGTQGSTVVGHVGGQTASAVASATITVDAATSTNTASTLVERDASGNFSAGTITASLTGNVTGNVSGSAASFTGSLSGDVTGTQSATTVGKIQGTAINPTAPTDTQVLIYNSTAAQWVPETLSGDISTTDSGIVTVDAIQTHPVSSTTPTDAQLLIYNGTSHQWNPENISGDITITDTGAVTLASTGVTPSTYGSSTQVGQFTVDAKGRVTSASNVTITGSSPGGTAGGDLSGTYPNPTVAAIQGHSVSTTAPTDAQLYVYNNSTSKWVPVSFSGDITIVDSGATTVNTVGGQTAANIATTVTTVQAATSLDTPSTLVERDLSGNFAMGVLNAGGINVNNTTGTASAVYLESATTTQPTVTVKRINSQTADLFQILDNSNNPQFVFDSTGNFKFYVSGTPQTQMDMRPSVDQQAINVGSPARFGVFIGDPNTPVAAGLGAGLALGGYQDNSGTMTEFGYIWTTKNNSTLGDIGAGMHFATRNNATSDAQRVLDMDSNGNSYFWGTVALQGATSGAVTLGVPSTVTSYPLTLPAAQGSTNSTLTNNGSGTLNWINYTNLNTASTLVERDSSGNFSAGTITASLNGNASTSTSFTGSLSGDVTGTQSATTVSKIQGTTVSGTTGSGNVVFSTSPSLTTPSFSSIVNTGTLTLPTSTDTLVARATTDTLINKTIAAGSNTISGLTNSNLSGSAGITGSNLATNTITNNNLAQVPANTLKGNNTASPTNVSDLTISQVNTMLGVTGSATSIGALDGQSPNANGLTLTGQVLYAQSATASFPGMVNNTTQTLSGNKTFSGQTTISNVSTDALTVNATSFVVDSTNNAIGIGIQPATTAVVDIVNNSGSTKAVQLTGYGSNVGLRGRYANGTAGSPTAATTGNTLEFISGRGYGTTGFAAASTGVINIVAGATFTDSSMPTYIGFNTTPSGSVTSTQRMQINSTGNILVGTTTDNNTDLVQVNGGVGSTYNKLNGATSGYVEQTVPSTVTSYNVTWPSSQGAAGTFLSNSDGAGTLTWANPITNIDGGYPSATYTTTQYINGGTP